LGTDALSELASAPNRPSANRTWFLATSKNNSTLKQQTNIGYDSKANRRTFEVRQLVRRWNGTAKSENDCQIAVLTARMVDRQDNARVW
jgi:hypothetical protein